MIKHSGIDEWTGSSAQRRPQGTCSPPKKHDRQSTSDWIPAHTPVLVRLRIGNSKAWKSHVTRKDLEITETLKRTSKSVIFAVDDWVVSVALKHIRHATACELVATQEVPDERTTVRDVN